MAEVLTESFCERCGTRYTFESAKPRVKRLTGVKVLSRGLKNFVLSDDSSLDEAMAAARSDTEREVTSQQLDAFHKTFNFCMSCRQYTCANCWNDAEGTCLTCSPHLGHEIMPAPFPDLDPLGTTVALGTVGLAAGDGSAPAGVNGNGHAAPAYDAGAWPTSDAWPSHDLTEDAPTADVPAYAGTDDEEIDAVARMAALTAIGSSQVTTPDPVEAGPEPEVHAPVEAAVAHAAMAGTIEVAAAESPVEAIVETEPEPEASIAAAVEPAAPTVRETPAAVEVVVEPTPSRPATPATRTGPRAHDAVAAAAAAQTADLLNRFRPGESLDAELDAYEREHAEAEALAAPAAEAVAADAAPIAEASSVIDDTSSAPIAVDALVTAAAASAIDESSAVETEAPVEAEAVAEPEPLAAIEPEPVAAAEPEPDRTAEIAAAAAAAAALAAAKDRPTDVVAQPTWRIVAPDAEPPAPVVVPPAPTPAAPVPPPAATAQSQWPAAPQWPEQRPAAGLPFLGRPVQPTGGLDSLWAESNREVASAAPAPGHPVAPAGVQPCVSCGLSLSATARFCRRCGTAQRG